jgi:serine/threonine-protein kinase
VGTQTRLPLLRSPFIDAVRKSGLLTPDDLVSVLSQFDPDEVANANPIQVATFLVKKKLLTKFQAMNLLAGKTQGFLLGKYKILDGLRQDRVGMVFRAENTETKQAVAVKVLPTDRIADPKVLKAFADEVKAAARVKHQTVAAVLDMNVHNGTYFVVSEYVPASTLDKIVAQHGPLSPADAAQVVAKAAVGLMKVHEKGLVHRDLKPSNIAVDNDGRVKLIDVGLTHMIDNPFANQTRRINMKEYADEVAHLAPEQGWGEELDARSDIYSLGSTFYFLLTGQVPFPGPALKSMADRQITDIPLPSWVRTEVSVEIDEIVRKLGAKHPADRPDSAAEVVALLNRWLPAVERVALGLPASAAPAKKKKAKAAPLPAAAPAEEPKAKAEKPAKKQGFFGRLFGKLFGR